MGNEVSYIIYGTTWCPFCEEAMALLDSASVPYMFLDLTEKEDFMLEVKEYYSSTTVPVILEGNLGLYKYIGGCSDLKERLNG